MNVNSDHGPFDRSQVFTAHISCYFVLYYKNAIIKGTTKDVCTELFNLILFNSIQFHSPDHNKQSPQVALFCKVMTVQ